MVLDRRYVRLLPSSNSDGAEVDEEEDAAAVDDAGLDLPGASSDSELDDSERDAVDACSTQGGEDGGEREADRRRGTAAPTPAPDAEEEADRRSSSSCAAALTRSVILLAAMKFFEGKQNVLLKIVPENIGIRIKSLPDKNSSLSTIQLI